MIIVGTCICVCICIADNIHSIMSNFTLKMPTATLQQMSFFCDIFLHVRVGVQDLLFHVNHLLTNDSHDIASLILFLKYARKMPFSDHFQ